MAIKQLDITSLTFSLNLAHLNIVQLNIKFLVFYKIIQNNFREEYRQLRLLK